MGNKAGAIPRGRALHHFPSLLTWTLAQRAKEDCFGEDVIQESDVGREVYNAIIKWRISYPGTRPRYRRRQRGWLCSVEEEPTIKNILGS